MNTTKKKFSPHLFVLIIRKTLLGQDDLEKGNYKNKKKKKGESKVHYILTEHESLPKTNAETTL